MHQEADDLVLRSGKLLKVMSLEYAPLMADMYWTRVVQYYGDKAVRHDANLEFLWPLLDVTTTLDPHLLVAYRFGSMFLSESAPRGAGRPDLGIQLIQRGIQANPDYWRLYEDLGFIYYFELHDYDKAGAAFLEGSKNPQAMPWMKVLAAKVSEQGDNPETSEFLWNEIYTSTKDPQMKENAATHLQLLKAEADCKAIDGLSDEFEKQNSRRPASIQELVTAGIVEGRAGRSDGLRVRVGQRRQGAARSRESAGEEKAVLQQDAFESGESALRECGSRTDSRSLG